MVERRRRPSIFDLIEQYMERMFEEMRRFPFFEEERRRRERMERDIEAVSYTHLTLPTILLV